MPKDLSFFFVVDLVHNMLHELFVFLFDIQNQNRRSSQKYISEAEHFVDESSFWPLYLNFLFFFKLFDLFIFVKQLQRKQPH